MKFFGLLLLSQAAFGLVCVIASYPEASAGLILASIVSCVAVNNATSSIALIFLSFEIIMAMLFESSREAYLFIQASQIFVSLAIILAHK